jgi:mRNA interferase RelE/StbE
MKYAVDYTKDAQQDMLALPKIVSVRIANKLEHYAQTDNPLEYATRLSGVLGDLYRYRIGTYRAIFRLVHGTVTIILVQKVAHRKDVYE